MTGALVARQVADALGRLSERCCWRQTTSMVYVELAVPEGTSARDLRVSMRPTHLSVTVGHEPLLDEELYMKIYVGSNTDDDCSIWEVQDKRVLEINPEHPMVRTLARLNTEGRPGLEPFARLLLDHAQIAEGRVADPAGFAGRLQVLMEKAASSM